MSQLLVQKYLNDLSDLKRSGSKRESVVREAFKILLRDWGKDEGLLFIAEYEHTTAMNERRYVDGALVEAQLRLPFGYWEAKDTDDDLDAEIAKKFRKGYPQDNIIFEDSETAVLIQNKREVSRCKVDSPKEIERLVRQFFEFEPEVIREFRKAVEQFREDLPAVLETLRKAIDKAEAENAAFKKAATKFLKHAQDTINPSVTASDVREMLIQHILTEEIFSQVFDNSDFHRRNNVAKELYALEDTFFTGGVKRETIDRLRPYYSAIKRAATSVSSHQEKQKFLKVIYENFYKVYNRKAADRLGVAYTPNEIVRFMIESADWLCHKNFDKRLIDDHVEILDPATGTGTFVVDLMEHFRGQPKKLKHKYLEELHANEVAILPYYVANLNIEATYAAITSDYLEYPNLCFVDTLDNVAGLGIYAGHQYDMLGALSDINIERIKRQNRRKISVIIGNPPYNAWQENFNFRNPNRPYKRVDERLKSTYVREGTAQNQIGVYDMYTRFFRWASDRISDDGVIAFITNRSYIDSRIMDGFRKSVTQEFSEIYIVDLGGDVRANPKLSGTKHNVFGIQTGVAIGFFVRKKGSKGKARIFYARRPEFETNIEKLAFLSSTQSIEKLELQEIIPDAKENWINLVENDFDSLLPLFDRHARGSSNRAMFGRFSMGIQPKCDDWIYEKEKGNLSAKMQQFITSYSKAIKTRDFPNDAIKWHRELVREARNRVLIEFDAKKIVRSLYRPFAVEDFYNDRKIISMNFLQQDIFWGPNTAIVVSGVGANQPFACIATNLLPSHDLLQKAQSAPRYFYRDGKRIDNISNITLAQFRERYEAKEKKRAIGKDDIFHYTYGVLHDPFYREKYAQNLKREFPRLPFYSVFWEWADWGKKLMEMHIGFENIEGWKLKRSDSSDKTAKRSGVAPKSILKANKNSGEIQLDSDTSLTGIPSDAWEYRLGNRSALEWILDQYKEKTPRDPVVREKFNDYRFANYKDDVIDLLQRVTRVSVETFAIVEQMKSRKNVR